MSINFCLRSGYFYGDDYLIDNFNFAQKANLSRSIPISFDDIYRCSGIKSRIIFPLVSQSKIMSECVLNMVNRDGLKLNEIDLLICASAVPEQTLPNTSSAILSHLGLNIYGIDINTSCLSFLSALGIAASFFQSGLYKNIVIVSCDLPHRCLNYNDNESSMIFGEGCVSFWFSKNDGKEVFFIDQKFKNYNNTRDICQIKIGGTEKNIMSNYSNDDFYFKMDGKKLFKTVLSNIDDFIDDFLEKNSLTKGDIDLVVPHQASHLGISHMEKKLGFKKIINIYEKYGNQVSVSLPHALLKADDLNDKVVLMLGTGAGLTIGATLLKF